MSAAGNGSKTVCINTLDAHGVAADHIVDIPDYGRERLEEVSFIANMTWVLMCNYAQTGHFGGPLAYTQYNVASHLAGPELGGLRYDIRHPKHPHADNFMITGGHNVPSAYGLWITFYEALARQHAATGDDKFKVDPNTGYYAIDALGFRRSADAMGTLLENFDLTDDPLFAGAKTRGIRALSGHSETIDATNDVNGGPSGVGGATSAGKALFWDFAGAPDTSKVIALEGEFAMTAGHAQEMKTIATAQEVGKRLRILLSYNNAGIDSSLIGGVIDDKYADDYSMPLQWSSYGWNVLTIDDGNDFDKVVAVMKAMEDWDTDDRRPMIAIGDTVKGWWPTATDGKIGAQNSVTSFASHAYGFPMNGDYVQALAQSFEDRFGVKFVGLADGSPAGERERLIQFKTNIDVVLSALDSTDGLRDWLTGRLVDIAGTLDEDMPHRLASDTDPFNDARLKVANLPTAPQEVTSAGQAGTVTLFEKAGNTAGTRRAISEIGKWLNYVTDNRFLTIAADLSGSINVAAAHFSGPYRGGDNPSGTELNAGIQEAGNAAAIAGLTSQSLSKDPAVHNGVWGLSGTYGSFTPLMYTPLRVYSQQNQDSPFAIGVVTVLAGHSGPETAADARTHFGIFAPQVWTLFPRGQVINLNFWDYNDVAPGYFAAVDHAVNTKEAGIIVIHVARPDFTVADRGTFADTDLKAAAKGMYLIRDFALGQEPAGTVFVQGSSSSFNLVAIIPRLEEAGLNVRIVSVISEELFANQPAAYRDSILPASARYDSMFITTGTKRVPPVDNLGPLAEEYSLSSDWDDRWRTGGTEPDIIAESRLDQDSIFDAVKRFVDDRAARLARQRNALS